MEVGTLVRVPDALQAAFDQAGLYQILVSIKVFVQSIFMLHFICSHCFRVYET